MSPHKNLALPTPSQAAWADAEIMTVHQLRCEYLENPLSIGTVEPRLSWNLQSGQRGDKQTAYQILVASSEELLKNDAGDMWDSGKVTSDETLNITYAGAPLNSRTRCWWKVRSWNCENQTSPWSELAWWRVGLLNRGDWQAKFVSPVVSLPRTTTHFGYRSLDGESATDEKWVQIDLESSQAIDSVRLWGAWPVKSSNSSVMPGDHFPARFRIDVSDDQEFSRFQTVIDKTSEDVPNPGAEALTIACGPVRARYVRFTATKLSGDYRAGWSVQEKAHVSTPCEPARGWRMLLAEIEVLSEGKNIALSKPVTALDSFDEHDQPFQPATQGYSKEFLTDGRIVADAGGPDGFRPQPVTLVRREMTVSKPVRSATLYATASIGFYEAYINGVRVGDNELAPEKQPCYESYLHGTSIANRPPGKPFERLNFHKAYREAGNHVERELTRYEEICFPDGGMYCQTYDVTALIQSGSNAIAAMLANGFEGMEGNFYNEDTRFQEVHRSFIAQLELEYEDGTNETIVTDRSWLCHNDGPFRKTFEFIGTMYDARKEVAGWNMPGASQDGWGMSLEDYEVPIDLFPQAMQPVRVLEELTPVGRTQLSHDTILFDFGRNMAGVCEVKLDGPEGAAVTIRHAEIVDEEGLPHYESLRGSLFNSDTIILSGRGSQSFRPRFTYHGFRYAEVSGLSTEGMLVEIKALVIGSAVPKTLSFTSSDKTLNTLAEMVDNTFRSNMFGLVVDVAGRNERGAWLGDCFTTEVQSLSYLYDFAAFGANENRAILSVVGDNGFPPACIAARYPNGNASAAFSDAIVVLPLTLWTNYADRRSLERSYEPAKKFMDAIAAKNPDFIPRNVYKSSFSDHLSSRATVPPNATSWEPKGNKGTSNEIIAAGWWAYSADLVSRMAVALNQTEDANRYSLLRDNIRKAIIAEYVDADGAMSIDVQSSYSLFLGMGHIPENSVLFDKMKAKCIQSVHDYDDHISTGTITTINLLKWLSANGCHDLACRMVLQPTCPSYGFMVACGATTMWETFDTWNPALGVNDGVQFGINHVGLNSVYEWIISAVGGIVPDPLGPGYKHFFVSPKMGGNISAAKTEYDSVRGKIICDWKVEETANSLRVVIPPNTAATVFVPAAEGAVITECGQPAEKAVGVKFLRNESGAAVYEVQSGSYEFHS